MTVLRTRLAVALASVSVIALELGLMRALSLRFWQHFAYMVISVALLGFGTSGTLLTVLRRHVQPRREAWMAGALLAFSLSIPLVLRAQGAVNLDVQFLAWDFGQAGGVLALEALLLVPFLLAASAIALALMDRPERVGGHYAANLAGSGAGAVLAVAGMHVLDTSALLAAVALAAFAGGAVVIPWRQGRWAAAGILTGSALGAILSLAPYRPQVSPYKMLPLMLATPEAQVIWRDEGPLGRLDVVAGPAIHYAPGLSLQFEEEVPPHVLLIVDGDQTSGVYDCRRREDWRFMDATTGAAAYALRPAPRACILGAGGGADVGLALYRGSPRVVALEMNGQVIRAMRGPLAGRGGGVYDAPGVQVVNREARGFLASTAERFDVIQLPAIDAFGASGAGLYATQEAYLYTVEALGLMLDRLTDRGLLCVTRWARTPPRDGLRVLDTAAEALRRRGLDPADHLVMIRNWATVTVLASPGPIGPEDSWRLREFCRARSFDLCWLPDLGEHETNRFHILDRPYYFEGAEALVGPDRQRFLDRYVFHVEATTDDRPYFFHFLRLRSLGVLEEQLGRRSRAFLEMGFVMLLVALAQSVVLAAVLIVLPLAPSGRWLARADGKGAALAYFLLLGAGFMVLEMALLGKLILYMAHPIYAAAAVIAGFLVFAGAGSWASGAWPGGPRTVVSVAAGAVVVLGAACALWLDRWLALSVAWPLGARFVVAAMTIAPLAFAMGHLFPLGLRAVGGSSPALVPWCWAVNGFASVSATVATPLVAMTAGFSAAAAGAVACYLLAGLLGRRLVGRTASP